MASITLGPSQSIPRLAHPLQSLILAFMLRLSAYTLYTPSHLCNIDSPHRPHHHHHRSSDHHHHRDAQCLAQPPALRRVVPDFPAPPPPPLLPNPCPRAHLASLRCRVVSLAWPSESTIRPVIVSSSTCTTIEQTSYNNTTFQFSTFKGRPHQPAS
jgi:hypothetical protein